MTSAIYDAIGNHFRSLWGKEAGWAHSVLFAADLRTFSERLQTKVEMTEVKTEPGSNDLSEEIIKTKIETEAVVKTDPEKGTKRTLVVEETARTQRAKKRKSS